jgi:hypothetical protein
MSIWLSFANLLSPQLEMILQSLLIYLFSRAILFQPFSNSFAILLFALEINILSFPNNNEAGIGMPCIICSSISELNAFANSIARLNALLDISVPYAEVIPSGNNNRLQYEIDQLDEIEPYEIDSLRARGYANLTGVT